MTPDELTIASRRADLWSHTNVIIHQRPLGMLTTGDVSPHHIYTKRQGVDIHVQIWKMSRGQVSSLMYSQGGSLIRFKCMWEYRTIKLHVYIIHCHCLLHPES